MSRNRRQPNQQHIDELLSAYLDGMLDPDERLMVERRLRQEPALRERLQGLRLAVRLLRELPQVEPPRNFILSPAMVAATRRPSRKRRARTWPVFGWATAAVALLFLLVFAGDVFLVAPAADRLPTDVIARAPRLSDEAPAPAPVEEQPEDAAAAAPEAELMTEAPASAPAAEGTRALEAEATAVVEAPAQKETVVQKEVVVETPAEENRGEAESALPAATETPARAVSEDRLAPTAEAAAELVTESAVITEEVELATPEPEVLEDVATSVAELHEETEAPPQALMAAPTQQATHTPQPEQPAGAEGTALAAAPEEETAREGVAAEETAEVVLPWLRLLEVGLGITLAVLVTMTLILRWRRV